MHISQIPNSSGYVLTEQPLKVGVALKLFLQGLGLAASLSFPFILPPAHSTPSDVSVQGKAAQLHHQCVAY